MITLIEKATEYNVSVWMAFLEYCKTFDTGKVLKNARIDSRYYNIVKSIYKNASLQMLRYTEKVQMKMAVR